MKYLFALLMLIIVGCDTKVSVSTNIDEKKVGEASKWTIVQSSKNWISKQFKSTPVTEEEKQAAEEALIKLEQEKIANIKTSDELVSSWTNRLSENQTLNEGFVHHEGLTEVDGWGNFIKVVYAQDGFYEKMRIVSSGPDGEFGTEDDLARERTSQKPFSFIQGLGFVGWCVFLWIISIPIMAAVFALEKTYSTKKRKHPILLALVAPFYLLTIVITGIVEVIGAIFEGGFD
jgi:hypothetical protein